MYHCIQLTEYSSKDFDKLVQVKPVIIFSFRTHYVTYTFFSSRNAQFQRNAHPSVLLLMLSCHLWPLQVPSPFRLQFFLFDLPKWAVIDKVCVVKKHVQSVQIVSFLTFLKTYCMLYFLCIFLYCMLESEWSPSPSPLRPSPLLLSLTRVWISGYKIMKKLRNWIESLRKGWEKHQSTGKKTNIYIFIHLQW